MMEASPQMGPGGFSDSAIVALTMLSAHAREKGSTVNYREESDGMIHERYVW